MISLEIKNACNIHSLHVNIFSLHEYIYINIIYVSMYLYIHTENLL